MKSKPNNSFAPGPWRNPQGSVSVFGGHNLKVCDMNWAGNRISEAYANARLIAAAPEMLQALQNMVETYKDHPQYDDSEEQYEAKAIAAARRAIAKAQGKLSDAELKETLETIVRAEALQHGEAA